MKMKMYWLLHNDPKPLISVIPVYMTYVDENATIPQYMEFQKSKIDDDLGWLHIPFGLHLTFYLYLARGCTWIILTAARNLVLRFWEALNATWFSMSLLLSWKDVKFDVTIAIGIAKIISPDMASILPSILPNTDLGTKSPYPSVVIVTNAHHRPVKALENLFSDSSISA